jgi:hypothetical protein
MASQRLAKITSHMSPTTSAGVEPFMMAAATHGNAGEDDPVVVVSALRTPITR